MTLVAAVLVVTASLVAASAVVVTPPAGAASPPQVSGVTVLSKTSVKVVFSQPMGSPSATTLSNYGVAPALPVTAATLTDGSRSVVLTTGAQLNGQAYTVTVRNVVAADGTPMIGFGLGDFIGTNQGPNSATAGHDDFNRPSGLVTADAPIPGPWLSSQVSTLNALSLTTNPVFGGTGALGSHVADVNPDNDNALVRYQLAAGSEYWLSAYVYVPSGQKWGSQQEIGLMRFMQSLEGSMARVSAIDQSSSTHFGLNVNWKTTGNAYLTTPPVIATDVPFDTWNWIEMHVKEAANGSQGEIQVWLNGKLLYGQNSVYVYPAKMVYSQVGIMHLVTQGPAATTITDEVRFGDSYQLPSSRFDTSAPTVSLTSPLQGSPLGSSMVLAAAASDDTEVQRVDFLVDGRIVNSDDFVPYQYTYNASGLSAGAHTVAAIAYDTSGNASATSSVTVGAGFSAISVTAPDRQHEPRPGRPACRSPGRPTRRWPAASSASGW